MPRNTSIVTALALAGALLLAACDGTGDNAPTPTPLPTSSLPGLVTIQPQLCRQAELPMLRVDDPQGDMLAWAPDGHTLAYLAPTTGSTWLVGALTMVSGPAFDAPLELADQAAGSLVWSPTGERLAYLSLRRSDGLFSVGIVSPQSGEARDLFPGEAARFDEWSSQKVVTGWEDEQHLRVQVSCGLDCIQSIELNLITNIHTPLGETAQRPWDWWAYTLYQPDTLSAQYLEIMREPNWSPDGQRLVYLDVRADAWVVNLDTGTQFPLDTGGFLAVSETDWSADGQYLAVHAEDWLFIFGSDCP